MNWKLTVTTYMLLVCFGVTSCTGTHSNGNLTGRGRFVSISHEGGGKARIWLGVNPQPDETFIWKGAVDAEGYASGVGSFATFKPGFGLTTFSTGRAIRGRMEGDSVKYIHWAPMRSVWLITLKNGKVQRKVKVADTMDEWARIFQGDSADRRMLAAQFPGAFPKPMPPAAAYAASENGTASTSGGGQGSGSGDGMAAAVIAVAVIGGLAYAAYKAFTGGGSSTPSYADFDDDDHDSGGYEAPSSSGGGVHDRVYFKAPARSSTETLGYHRGGSIYTSDNTWVGTERGNSFYARDGTYVGKYEGSRVYSKSGDWLGDFKNGAVIDRTGSTKAHYSVPTSGDEAAALSLGLFKRPQN